MKKTFGLSAALICSLSFGYSESSNDHMLFFKMKNLLPSDIVQKNTNGPEHPVTIASNKDLDLKSSTDYCGEWGCNVTYYDEDSTAIAQVRVSRQSGVRTHVYADVIDNDGEHRKIIDNAYAGNTICLLSTDISNLPVNIGIGNKCN